MRTELSYVSNMPLFDPCDLTLLATKSARVSRVFEFYHDRKGLPEGWKFVLDSKEEAKFVVESLGSHMGDITTCLLGIVEEGMSPKGIFTPFFIKQICGI